MFAQMVESEVVELDPGVGVTEDEAVGAYAPVNRHRAAVAISVVHSSPPPASGIRVLNPRSPIYTKPVPVPTAQDDCPTGEPMGDPNKVPCVDGSRRTITT